MTIESPDRIQNPKDGTELERTLPHRPCPIENIYSPAAGAAPPPLNQGDITGSKDGTVPRSGHSSGDGK